jgi:hypothetical protein
MREALDQPHGWTVVPVGPLITYERECESLARVGDGSEGALGPLLPMMLDPGTAARRARGQLARVSSEGGWVGGRQAGRPKA